MVTRTSILYDKVALTSAVAQASSIKEALTLLGLRAAGGNYKALKAACEHYEIAPPNYDKSTNTAHLHIFNKIPNSQVFVENSTYVNRRLIKKRMFDLGIKNICDECGQEPTWNGKPLTLTLDHINGIWNDNRLNNLRILCGHCHSQTDTFAGKTGIRSTKAVNLCLDCKEIISAKATHCYIHARANRSDAPTYPSTEKLLKDVQTAGFRATGKKLGLSDNAVRRRLKRELGPDHEIFHTKVRSNSLL